MNVNVEVQRESVAPDIPADEDFRCWVEAALSAAELAAKNSCYAAEVVIRLVDEHESCQLNATYRDRNYPTNVLSFQADLVDLPESLRDSLDSAPLGDLVICAPVVLREATEQNKSVKAHWAHMVIHGCLHLLGYDHEVESDAEAMESVETRIMKKLRFGNPYLTDHN